ncbi:MAG: acyl carrier protein [Candidatus Faecalibacterium intestinavium]|uniref:Acyl carrier protein n=1 Tax=Candidatus Faecalibacterium intestinavium TaxID=2838580 RepID=A0A9E2NQ04_9FIRM|nr:acyl carrier protein [Candidatus Faecalibacterium intestinavium]
MQRSEILDQIKTILEDVAEISPEEVTEDSVLMDDLDLSSMEILTIVADLEESFGIRIPEKELRGFVTVGDLADYLLAQEA